MQQFAAQEIGARIKQARLERGLSQDELSDMAVGFSKRSLQDYEGGRSIPYKHFDELGKLLGKETSWFLYGADETNETDEVRLREIVREELQEVRQILERVLERLPPDDAPT